MAGLMSAGNAEKVSAIAVVHKHWDWAQQTTFTKYFFDSASGNSARAIKNFTVTWDYFYNAGTRLYPIIRCLTDGTQSALSGTYTFTKGKRYDFIVGSNSSGTGNGYQIVCGVATEI